MMDELLNRVTEKTGMSQDQAKAAVDSVLGFLKEKLPAPLAGGLNSLVGGGESGAEASEEGQAGKASAMLGNLFSKRTE